jgi:hypothetical protein
MWRELINGGHHEVGPGIQESQGEPHSRVARAAALSRRDHYMGCMWAAKAIGYVHFECTILANVP